MTASIKRALVTGGSGEIGGAICQRLARDGCHVIVHANRNTAEAERLSGAIGEAGHSAEAVSFDLTDRQAAAAALETLLKYGAIQVPARGAPASMPTPPWPA